MEPTCAPAPAVMSRLSQIEIPICRFCNRIRNPGVLRLFAAVSWLGNGPFWAASAAVLLTLEGAAGLTALEPMVITGVIAFTLYKLLKKGTARPRPFAAEPGFRLTVAPTDQYSFPSGHTLHAVAFTLVLAVHYPPLGWLALPFTVLVALSRIVLGLHYPSDVVAGSALGGAVALLVLWI